MTHDSWIPRLSVLGAALLSARSIAQQYTYTFSLASPSNSQTVTPGQSIVWTINSQSDSVSLGLAGFTVDLVQDSGNPATIEIPPASSVPTALAGFSRPAGISNPSPGTTPGYCGTPVGVTGNKNLIEIGGLQNTYGITGGATTIGQDVNVDSNIGSGSTGHTLASGSFPAPSTPGTYTFRLESAFATELVLVATAPAPSAAMDVNVTLSDPISFTVVAPSCDPDINCDGNADQDDVICMIDVVAGNGGCECQDPDFNQDGNVDQDDVIAIIAVVAGGPCP